jgi:hypothetical protein
MESLKNKLTEEEASELLNCVKYFCVPGKSRFELAEYDKKNIISEMKEKGYIKDEA